MPVLIFKFTAAPNPQWKSQEIIVKLLFKASWKTISISRSFDNLTGTSIFPCNRCFCVPMCLQDFILCLQLQGFLLEKKLSLPLGSSLKTMSSNRYLKCQRLWMTGYIQLSQTKKGSSCTYMWNLLVRYVWTSFTWIHTVISSRCGTVYRQKYNFRWVITIITPFNSLLNLLVIGSPVCNASVFGWPFSTRTAEQGH